MFTFIKDLFKNKDVLILDNIEDRVRIVQNELGMYGLQRAVQFYSDDKNENFYYWTTNIDWIGTNLEYTKQKRLDIINKMIYEKKFNTVTGVVPNVEPEVKA